MIWPALIAHADWGTDPRKRQVAVARSTRGNGDGSASYVVESLGPATDGRWFFGQLRAAAGPGQAMIGFDFPIGLPRAYAAAAGIAAFPAWLAALGTPPWESFHLVAAQPGEITRYRPFYPMRPGGTRREHLHLALGLSARDLRRRCEGNDAEALFWTLGGKQVGKGALIGWQLIAAARRARPGILLWPFDGPLSELLTGRAPTVVADDLSPRVLSPSCPVRPVEQAAPGRPAEADSWPVCLGRITAGRMGCQHSPASGIRVLR